MRLLGVVMLKFFKDLFLAQLIGSAAAD